VSSVQNPYPKEPQNVDSGPLVGGMVRNKGTDSLSPGEVLTAKNWHAEPTGLTRRPGSVAFAGGATVVYAPVRDLLSFFKMDATQKIGVLDSRFLYLQSGTSLVRQGLTYSTGTMKTSGAYLVAAGAVNFSTGTGGANIMGGDYALLKPGASQQELQVVARTTKSKLQLASAPSPGPYAAGSAYKVYKGFNYVGNSKWVDWAIAPVTKTTGQPKIVLADGRRPLWSWDGGTLSTWAAALTFIPLCVCYFQDRVYCGNIIEGANTFKRRWRWSTTLDATAFIGTPDTQWVDRPYGDGELLRIVPFGKLLAGFYSDGIDIARPSNYAGDTNPLAFEQLNTGGSGLVGMRAVKRFYDGVFCALSDGFYFLDNNGFQNIGEAIWKHATEGVLNMQGTVVEIDWRNRSVVFGVPSIDGSEIGVLWVYNYETKKWSWDDVPCSMLGTFIERASGLTWDNAPGTWDSQTLQWDSIAASYRGKLAFGRSGKIGLYDPSALGDFDGSNIDSVIETGDWEFDEPQKVKTAFQLVLEANGNMSADAPFTVEGSTDRGLTWKALGTLVIRGGSDKAQLTFKLTGHMMRFRITFAGQSPSFTISGYSMRVRVRGRETHFG